ncbi:hypothetical protein GM182_07085 [bacterium 3DAC]|nr:hypothetical protein GM182_07085 [bacterium 3DAC]
MSTSEFLALYKSGEISIEELIISLGKAGIPPSTIADIILKYTPITIEQVAYLLHESQTWNDEDIASWLYSKTSNDISRTAKWLSDKIRWNKERIIEWIASYLKSSDIPQLATLIMDTLDLTPYDTAYTLISQNIASKEMVLSWLMSYSYTPPLEMATWLVKNNYKTLEEITNWLLNEKQLGIKAIASWLKRNNFLTTSEIVKWIQEHSSNKYIVASWISAQSDNIDITISWLLENSNSSINRILYWLRYTEKVPLEDIAEWLANHPKYMAMSPVKARLLKFLNAFSEKIANWLYKKANFRLYDIASWLLQQRKWSFNKTAIWVRNISQMDEFKVATWAIKYLKVPISEILNWLTHQTNNKDKVARWIITHTQTTPQISYSLMVNFLEWDAIQAINFLISFNKDTKLDILSWLEINNRNWKALATLLVEKGQVNPIEVANWLVNKKLFPLDNIIYWLYSYENNTCRIVQWLQYEVKVKDNKCFSLLASTKQSEIFTIASCIYKTYNTSPLKLANWIRETNNTPIPHIINWLFYKTHINIPTLSSWKYFPQYSSAYQTAIWLFTQVKLNIEDIVDWLYSTKQCSMKNIGHWLVYEAHFSPIQAANILMLVTKEPIKIANWLKYDIHENNDRIKNWLLEKESIHIMESILWLKEHSIISCSEIIEYLQISTQKIDPMISTLLRQNLCSKEEIAHALGTQKPIILFKISEWLLTHKQTNISEIIKWLYTNDLPIDTILEWLSKQGVVTNERIYEIGNCLIEELDFPVLESLKYLLQYFSTTKEVIVKWLTQNKKYIFALLNSNIDITQQEALHIAQILIDTNAVPIEDIATWLVEKCGLNFFKVATWLKERTNTSLTTIALWLKTILHNNIDELLDVVQNLYAPRFQYRDKLLLFLVSKSIFSYKEISSWLFTNRTTEAIIKLLKDSSPLSAEEIVLYLTNNQRIESYTIKWLAIQTNRNIEEAIIWIIENTNIDPAYLINIALYKLNLNFDQIYNILTHHPSIPQKDAKELIQWVLEKSKWKISDAIKFITMYYYIDSYSLANALLKITKKSPESIIKITFRQINWSLQELFTWLNQTTHLSASDIAEWILNNGYYSGTEIATYLWENKLLSAEEISIFLHKKNGYNIQQVYNWLTTKGNMTPEQAFHYLFTLDNTTIEDIFKSISNRIHNKEDIRNIFKSILKLADDTPENIIKISFKYIKWPIQDLVSWLIKEGNYNVTDAIKWIVNNNLYTLEELSIYLLEKQLLSLDEIYILLQENKRFEVEQGYKWLTNIAQMSPKQAINWIITHDNVSIQDIASLVANIYETNDPKHIASWILKNTNVPLSEIINWLKENTNAIYTANWQIEEAKLDFSDTIKWLIDKEKITLHSAIKWIMHTKKVNARDGSILLSHYINVDIISIIDTLKTYFDISANDIYHILEAKEKITVTTPDELASWLYQNSSWNIVEIITLIKQSTNWEAEKIIIWLEKNYTTNKTHIANILIDAAIWHPKDAISWLYKNNYNPDAISQWFSKYITTEFSTFPNDLTQWLWFNDKWKPIDIIAFLTNMGINPSDIATWIVNNTSLEPNQIVNLITQTVSWSEYTITDWLVKISNNNIYQATSWISKTLKMDFKSIIRLYIHRKYFEYGDIIDFIANTLGLSYLGTISWLKNVSSYCNFANFIFSIPQIKQDTYKALTLALDNTTTPSKLFNQVKCLMKYHSIKLETLVDYITNQIKLPLSQIINFLYRKEIYPPEELLSFIQIKLKNQSIKGVVFWAKKHTDINEKDIMKWIIGKHSYKEIYHMFSKVDTNYKRWGRVAVYLKTKLGYSIEEIMNIFETRNKNTIENIEDLREFLVWLYNETVLEKEDILRWLTEKLYFPEEEVNIFLNKKLHI